MSHSFSATLLLRESWPLDIDTVVKTVSALVPDLERVECTTDEIDQAEAITLHLDDTEVVVHGLSQPVRPQKFSNAKQPYQAWIPQDLIDCHQAHFGISCGGSGGRMRDLETFAAAVHVVATAICDCTDVGAVYWDSAELFVRPDDFVAAFEPLMEGRMPVSSWIGFHPIQPDEFALNSAVGMITSGLRHFVGREIELAPIPTSLDHARTCLGSVVQRLMDHHLNLQEGETVEDLEMALKATVRTRDRWIRRDQSAFVLVTDDSVIDRSTLRPDRRRGNAARRQTPPAA